ncbi:hypothetical protein [Nakamurella sp. PAMC28650]|uniref:hypothetical protein n=1 Tax=Nakamurella sp. PAMC28650 TaxID=2762325 RepID=UPI00164E17DB|nr:hypothetical protein [Nakamurella sp. PAMC28650]QNK81083.1 hypothetical protein H7F38_23960 [Nakamurella sp. PAMC28650]
MIAESAVNWLHSGAPVVLGSYEDAGSGRTFVVARPADEPALWQDYFRGARRNYRRYGVEQAVNFDEAATGESTAVFVAAVDPNGQVVGGLRAQGPFSRVEQVYALREWAGRKGTDQLRKELVQRMDEGVVEIKAVWVEHGAARHGELTTTMSRAFVHVLRLLQVRYALCTAASHALPRWRSSGGVVSTGVSPVPYPDERYLTWLMWWDRQEISRLISADQNWNMERELQQLLGSAARGHATATPAAR